jgi:Rrf2 family protein
MRISVKGRYALAAMLDMACHYGNGELVTVVSISERLGISKIYLEQVFSLLKRGGLVSSSKGAQGGYQLARAPRQLTALDVLSAVELSLFEAIEPTVAAKASPIEQAMQERVFEALDRAVTGTLSGITLADLAGEAEKRRAGQAMMFYI